MTNPCTTLEKSNYQFWQIHVTSLRNPSKFFWKVQQFKQLKETKWLDLGLMKMCNILKPTQSKSKVMAVFNILAKYLRGFCREWYKLLHLSWLPSQKVLCSSLCMVAPFLVYNVHLDSNQNKGCRKAEKRLVLFFRASQCWVLIGNHFEFLRNLLSSSWPSYILPSRQKTTRQ